MVVLTQKEQIARSRLCLPLDVDSSKKAISLVRELRDYIGLVKVGYELITYSVSEGVNIVDLMNQEGVQTFWDIKLKDIKNTVLGAARGASKLGVYAFNLHADGASEMMRAALQGAREGAEIYNTQIPNVWGVTVLTSIKDKQLNEELEIPGTVTDKVVCYAKLAKSCGLDGVVCSAAELYALKQVPELNGPFMYVTPGIQAVGGAVGADQNKDRVFTPGNAIKYGSTILVAGRTITHVEDSKNPGKLIPATPDEMRKNAYGILQDMARNL